MSPIAGRIEPPLSSRNNTEACSEALTNNSINDSKNHTRHQKKGNFPQKTMQCFPIGSRSPTQRIGLVPMHGEQYVTTTPPSCNTAPAVPENSTSMKRKRGITTEAGRVPAHRCRIELVERKGTGHPDTMCDAIMEAVCLSLCDYYQRNFGRILHHNLDKGLLVAGRSAVRPGGGTILEPMKLIFGDRATTRWEGRLIPVGEIAEAAAARWISTNLRHVDPATHLRFQNEIRPGSPELTGLFERGMPGANDTSVGIGHAPATPLEELVLETERFLNSATFKERFPETGEDVKVMGCRNGSSARLTVAVAFVDRFIADVADYFERKAAVADALHAHLGSLAHPFRKLELEINTLDDESKGESGIYLTVLGTSAESADSGQVGRGNRVNGLISFCRPFSMEAAAGKNPVSHVGKIYNLLCREAAWRIVREVEGVEEVSIMLCSQIGQPLDEPLCAHARLVARSGFAFEPVRAAAEAIIEEELAGIAGFTARVARGAYRVC